MRKRAGKNWNGKTYQPNELLRVITGFKYDSKKFERKLRRRTAKEKRLQRLIENKLARRKEFKEKFATLDSASRKTIIMAEH